jgi:nitrate reductase gamma subunit
MSRARTAIVATAALLLGVLPLVVAHGDESKHGDMDMHDAPQPPVSQSEAPTSYWSLSEHAGLMYMHIALEVFAWFIVLPVGRLLHVWSCHTHNV